MTFDYEGIYQTDDIRSISDKIEIRTADGNEPNREYLVVRYENKEYWFVRADVWQLDHIWTAWTLGEKEEQ